jgi:hypothetical protein
MKSKTDSKREEEFEEKWYDTVYSYVDIILKQHIIAVVLEHIKMIL